MIVKCKTCNKEFDKKESEIKRTKNNFCSKSCAAILNNKNPKRELLFKYCKKCHNKIERENYKNRKKLCLNCRPKRQIFDENTTKIKDFHSKRNYQINSQIRYYSRKKYFKQFPDCKCLICGYDKHIEICHIKAINSFDKNAFISEVNDISNLVSLCPNHHWEFDNNQISMKTISQLINNRN